MYEKELLTIIQKISGIVKESTDPASSAAQLEALKEETAQLVSSTSPEFYNVASTICEATGDVWIKAKNLNEAEKSYKEMIQIATKAYQIDKTKYDFRLGFSYYKLASFYRTALQCAVLTPTPKVLTDAQQKIYNAAEELYKNAVGCTMANAKKGILNIVNFHALCMSEMLIFYAAVGNYQSAISCGKDGVQLDKLIYEKYDDKKHSYRLANRMNSLATVYMFMKNVKLAAETMEDAIFVLEEHEEDDPVTFGIMLARSYITLASCYNQHPEEKEQADATYEKGLALMLQANNKSTGRFTNDVLTAYMVVGDHYRRKNKLDLANERYNLALQLATILHAQTKKPVYENTINRLKSLLQK